MRLASFVLVALTAPALAEEPAPELEISFTPDAAVASAGVFADAASTKEVRAGGWLEGAAEWRYWRSYAYVRGQAEAALRAGADGVGLTFEQDAATRPYVLPFFQFEFAQRAAFDVAPKLSDRPDRWRRRYRAIGFDIDLIGLQYIGKHFGAQMMRVDNGFDFEDQLDGDDTVHRFITTADWAIFSFTRRAHDEEVGRLDPIALEATGIDGAYEGAVMTTFYPRLTNVQIGDAWFDAAYGRASTAYQTIRVNGEVVSQIDSLDLPIIKTPAWRARVGVRGDVDAFVGVARGLHLTADAALVLEERATAELATTLGAADVRATGFAARSRMWTSPEDVQDFVTGGAGLAIAMPVRGGWVANGSAEVARTFYATLESDRALHVDTAVRLDLGLRREIRNWVPNAGTVTR